MLEPITKQELIDASADAATLEQALNGAPDALVTSRLGRQYKTLATVDRVISEAEAATASFIATSETAFVELNQAIEIASAAGSGAAGWTDLLVATAGGRTQRAKNAESVSVKDFGAIGEGTLHMVAEWHTIGAVKYRGYANLAAVQVDYPHVTSSTDTIDWAAIQQAVNTPNVYKLYFPSGGSYHIGSNEILIPNTRSNITFCGQGAADVGATIINATPNKNGYVAITAKCYAFTLLNLALISTTGNADGFSAIGFLHMRDVTGSTGRLCHKNLRVQGFSKHAVKVGQAINYQFDNVTFTGGVETLWIGRDASNAQRSTTVSVYSAYITGGARCGVYLDRPSDFMADRLIVESCGKGTDPSTGTFYADAAGLISQGTGQCQLNAPYFEDNRRNIYSDGAIVTIAPNYGPATLPDTFAYNPALADNQKGRVEIIRNTVRTRYLAADPFAGHLDVSDEIRFNAAAKFNLSLVAKSVSLGSSTEYGRTDGLRPSTLLVIFPLVQLIQRRMDS